MAILRSPKMKRAPVRLLVRSFLIFSFLLGGCGGADETDTTNTGQSDYTVTAQASEGGDVLPDIQTIPSGSAATLEVVPERGYLIEEVTGCGGALQGQRYMIDQVDSDCTVTASFTAAEFPISGSVEGLAGSLELSLEMSSSQETLTVSNENPDQSASFTFTNQVPVNETYEVAVTEQPEGQECLVENAFGEVTAGGVGDITVACSTPARAANLSGTITPAANIGVDSDVNDILARYANNSSFTRAQPLYNRVTLHGFASDVPTEGAAEFERFADTADPNDFYQVALQEGQRVQLQVVDFDGFDVGSVHQGDLDLFLYDANRTLKGYSDKVTEFEEIVVPETGSYFIRVNAYSGISKYVLRLAPAESADPPLTPTAKHERKGSSLDFVPGEMILRLDKTKEASSTPSTSQVLAKLVPGGHLKTGSGLSSHAGPMLVGLDLSSDDAGGQQQLGLAGLKATNPEAHDKTVTLRRIKQARLQDGVKYAEPNYLRKPLLSPNDPGFRYQWHYLAINLPQAWDLSTGEPSGDEVVVAIVDTGIVLDHPDLQDQLVGGYDFISDPERALDEDGIDPNADDPGDQGVRGQSSWHGTHVAGTIAAATDNRQGVAGISWGARLMPIRVLGGDGGSSYDIIQGLRYAAGLPNDSGTVPPRAADVANLSLGSHYGSMAEQEAINEVRATGMIIVAAAGNENTSTRSYPAAYEGVISVSATDINNERAPYSNYGRTIDVAAPGGNMTTDANGDGYADGVLSTLVDDASGSREPTYAFYHGTSMAAPHVAGVIALMKAVYPEMTADELEQILESGNITQDFGTPGRDDIYGHGLIDARLAVQVAQELAAGEPLPEPPSQLVAVPTMLNLGVADSAVVQVGNIGGGDPQLVSAVARADWLTVSEREVDDSGLGSYDISVDRGSLPPGLYQSEVVFSFASGKEVRVQVAMQVGVADTESETAQLYVLLLDAESREIVDAVAAEPLDNSPSYQYQFTEVPVGRYLINAGSDIDVDYVICQSGEVCGAYPTLDNRSQVEVTGSDEDNLDFVVNILGGFPSTSNAPVADKDQPGTPGLERTKLSPAQ